MKNQRYHYQRMDDPSQIRLISIVPRQDKKRIHLKLELASIDEVDARYEAVSYKWGSPEPERHVIINGKTLRLRDNIWRCLKHLRDHELTRSRLLIDSICIDQNDEQEKSQQVAKMAHIFQNASRVLIWLGSTSLQTYLLTPGMDSLQHSIESLSSKDLDAWIDVLGYSDPKSRSLENQIMSIVYNSYWERLWIIQENVLAQDVCIAFGKVLLDRDCLCAMYQAARENSKPGYRSWISRQSDPNIIRSGTGILDHHPIAQISPSTGSGQKYLKSSSLTELIRVYHWHSCTDPRDCVFGLLGLLDPCRRLEVDYTASNEGVAVRALQYLEEEGAFEFTHHRCVDLPAAAALLKALTVTSFTYSKFEQELFVDKVEAMQSKSFQVHFKPMMILATDDSVLRSEVEMQVPYEDVIQLNVSGNLMKNLYQMKRSNTFQVRLLNGQIRQFTYARDSNQLEKKFGHVCLCFLGMMPVVIVRRDANDNRAIKIEHFIWPDMTRQLYESPLDIEIQLPTIVQSALQREFNGCCINWDDLRSSSSFNSFIRLSTLELVAICELIAPICEWT
ncbi:hypothetical protein RBB50_006151 [Rhinocladiella similis]